MDSQVQALQEVLGQTLAPDPVRWVERFLFDRFFLLEG